MFTNKEEYLQFRSSWRTNYKELSDKIRLWKSRRKTCLWEYRTLGDRSSKKKVSIGRNPNYDGRAYRYLEKYQHEAREQLKLLQEAKALSKELKNKMQ